MNTDATTTLHAWMRAHEDELIDFLRRIVNMDTATANRPGVEALAALMAAELAGLGFAVERPAGVRPEQAWLDDAFMGAEAGKGIAPGVVGRLGGGSGRGKLLLIAHLDTAFPPGSPAENPFRIDNERAFGTAVADMKGGVAGILFACRALLATGVERPAQITVLFDTDEQAGSIWSRHSRTGSSWESVGGDRWSAEIR